MKLTSLFSIFDTVRFNADHYNSITDAWKHIFGDNFHFGYFATPTSTLDEATDGLIEKMASLARISGETKILDVGCGIGNPAFYLHQKTACDITGISTSETGIRQAQEECVRRGFQQKVRFQVADGLNTGLPPQAFDVVWVMESSHLMKDKRKLFAECWRVLKPGGVVVLCDIMMRRPYTFVDRFGYFVRMKYNYIAATLDNVKAFGWIRMELFDTYTRTARAAGFNPVTLVDISDQVMPTFDRWKENILANEVSVLKTLSPNQVKSFINGTDLSKDFFQRKIGGYAIVKAVKP